MEEITTRFEIVRLAVKMADHETVAIQAKKLRDISLDEDLNEIIGLLESKNYRQALFLMKGYVSSLDDSFFHEPISTPKSKKPKASEPPQTTQNLFDMMQPHSNQTIKLDDMLRMTEESAEETVAYRETEYTADTYIAEVKEGVEKNESHLDIYKNRAENKKIKPFEEAAEEELVDMHGRTTMVEALSDPMPKTVEQHIPSIEPEIENSAIPKEEPIEEVGFEENVLEATKPNMEISGETSAETKVSDKAEVTAEYDTTVSTTAEDTVSEQEKDIPEHTPDKEISFGTESEIEAAKEQTEKDLLSDLPDTTEENSAESVESLTAMEETVVPPVTPVVKEVDILQERDSEEERLKAKRKEDYTKENRRYPPISYIDQKFRNMRHQFPQTTESEEGIVDEVKVLLRQVATQGYTENDIYEAIHFFQEKKAEGKMAEAAQMLLLAAASESKYAQLLLARELFKGEVLKVDYPEAFTQINRLAEHDYPEAICDLAQLYEYGYGIKKDKKTAQLLYEEAAEMGVARAQKHVERFSSKKGILSAFFK